MKQKMTYVLLFTVVVVWGLVFYNIFNRHSDAAGEIDIDTGGRSMEKPKWKRYVLKLDYRNPFGHEFEDPKAFGNKVQDTTQKIQDTEVIDWSIIKVSGLIKNAGTKRIIPIIKINDKDYLVNVGETVQEITLLSIGDGFVKVKYHGMIKTIMQ